MILMVELPPFAGSGSQPLLEHEGATVSALMHVALWPMVAGYLAVGRARR
jgi:hypothetical protein